MSYYYNSTPRPATPKQVAFIASLRQQKGLEPLGFTGTSRQASAEIDRLLSLPAPVQDRRNDFFATSEAEAQRAEEETDRTARREAAERDAFGGLAETFPARPSDAPRYGRGGTYVSAPPATQKQMDYFRSLVDSRQAPADDREEGTVSGAWEALQEGTLTARQASAAIDILARQPRVQVVQDDPEVPAGRYALVTTERQFEPGVSTDVSTGWDVRTVKFYRVDRPTEGRWAGRTFVKVQASDEFHPVRGSAASEILRRIAADPREASLRYGREIGSCGVCGRTLTDEESRARGIGPVCAAATGW